MDTKFEFTGTPSELMSFAEVADMSPSFKIAVAGFSECAGGLNRFVLKYECKAQFLGGDGKPFVHFSIDPA